METKTATETFVYASYIRSTPQKVWEALTQSEFTTQYWFGFRIEVEPKKGGKVSLIPPQSGQSCTHRDGQVLVWDPYRTLSYTWVPMSSPDVDAKRDGPSRVTFELSAIDDQVKLLLVHENLVAEDTEKDPHSTRGINNGWPAVLSSMKSLLETGKPIVIPMPKKG